MKKNINKIIINQIIHDVDAVIEYEETISKEGINHDNYISITEGEDEINELLIKYDNPTICFYENDMPIVGIAHGKYFYF